LEVPHLDPPERERFIGAQYKPKVQRNQQQIQSFESTK
jgi:hypothetical protein